MKKVVLGVLIIMSLGCALDSQNQEQYRCHAGGGGKTKTEHTETTVYVDEDGEVITDPDVIADIESKL